MKELKAFLFDLGNVLIHWNPGPLLDELGEQAHSTDGVSFCDIANRVLLHAEKGPMSEACRIGREQYPDHAHLFDALSMRWGETIGAAIEPTVHVLEKLKKEGYKLYMASNWVSDHFEPYHEKMPFLPLFDGLFISGYEGVAKPEAAFFEKLLETFSLNREETIFIDDREKNIKGAEAVGIQGILFTSGEALEHELKQLQVAGF